MLPKIFLLTENKDLCGNNVLYETARIDDGIQLIRKDALEIASAKNTLEHVFEIARLVQFEKVLVFALDNSILG